jgi:hypothetical protein
MSPAGGRGLPVVELTAACIPQVCRMGWLCVFSPTLFRMEDMIEQVVAPDTGSFAGVRIVWFIGTVDAQLSRAEECGATRFSVYFSV